MKIIIVGAPGSGKGTQATTIAKEFSLTHISTGDIFRENIANKTPIGLEVKKIIDSGNLCPDSLTIELVKERLSREDCKNGYLLDGFPRNVEQAKALDTFSPPDLLLELDIDFKKIEHRITGRRCCKACGNSFHVDVIGDKTSCPDCGGALFIRKDDTKETVQTRLDVYVRQTLPVVDYYEKQGRNVVINADQPVEKVFKDIEKAINDYFKI